MKIIIGNWKMNGTTEMLEEMIGGLDNIATKNTVILCVPYTLLCGGGKNLSIGAQDVSEYSAGAYTGQVSASMVRDTGAKYTIVGHSERGDSNQTVLAKANQAIQAGLIPIICVGETADEHESGKTMAVIENAIRESVPTIAGRVIIAYEPRWAIGTGKTPIISEIQSVHEKIHSVLESMGMSETSVVYGGSVTPQNAQEIMSVPHVDGVLVGGASLKIDDFITIIESAI